MGENVDKPFSYKLYHPKWVGIATLIGSPLAGAILLALNYRSLGKSKTALSTVIIGIAITMGLIAYSMSPIALAGTGSLLGLALAFAAWYIAKTLQGEMFEKHLQNGGEKGSGWVACGIGFLALVIQAVVIFWLVGLLHRPASLI